jgi:hypothetical protein
VPSIASIGALILPFTTGKRYQTPNTAAGMLFSFTNKISDNVSLGYNPGVEWDSETSVPGYIYSASLGKGMSERLGIFIENYGSIYGNGEQDHLADIRLSFFIKPNLQLCISRGAGINKHAINSFPNFGFSYRLPE